MLPCGGTAAMHCGMQRGWHLPWHLAHSCLALGAIAAGHCRKALGGLTLLQPPAPPPQCWVLPIPAKGWLTRPLPPALPMLTLVRVLGTSWACRAVGTEPLTSLGHGHGLWAAPAWGKDTGLGGGLLGPGDRAAPGCRGPGRGCLGFQCLSPAQGGGVGTPHSVGCSRAGQSPSLMPTLLALPPHQQSPAVPLGRGRHWNNAETRHCLCLPGPGWGPGQPLQPPGLWQMGGVPGATLVGGTFPCPFASG